MLRSPPLYAQVLVAVASGVLLGHFSPATAVELKPLGDAFIRLIKMGIAPIVFTTVVVGIAKMGDLKQVGRVGLKSVVYFEVVSTLALLIGLVVVNVVRPGDGVNADLSALPKATEAKPLSAGAFLLHAIPESVVGAFAAGDVLQVLLFAILFGVALAGTGDRGKSLVELLDQVAHVLFSVIGLVMRLAPVGAFGAMAYTVGAFGLDTLGSLGKLLACVYLTCGLFVAGVLGTIVRLTGFRLWPFLRYLRDEIVIVLGTSSSEAALPRLMTKLENAGCAKPVVGLVLPTGYSFNLDGTAIYLTMAAVFVAQATNTPLGLGRQLALLAVLLLTSKGAAAVTGGGFVTLAATLSVFPEVPAAGLALLLGVDRFLSEARAVTNLIGNAVATVVVARWEGALERDRLRTVLAAGELIPGPPVATIQNSIAEKVEEVKD